MIASIRIHVWAILNTSGREQALLPHIEVLCRLFLALSHVSPRAVSGLKELTALNLGYNKLDDESSEMLRNYLTSGHASVRKLVLARADIDDGECDAFVKAVACNESLTSVDLSNNLIGAMEIKNAVQPDFNTGRPLYSWWQNCANSPRWLRFPCMRV
jgi:hypothetical protein